MLLHVRRTPNLTPRVSQIELSGSTDWQIAPFNVCIFQPTISAQAYEKCVSDLTLPFVSDSLLRSGSYLLLRFLKASIKRVYVGQVAARTCTIVADLSVLAITWSRTFPKKVGGVRVVLRSGLATCMLKDGVCTLYRNPQRLNWNTDFRAGTIYFGFASCSSSTHLSRCANDRCCSVLLIVHVVGLALVRKLEVR